MADDNTSPFDGQLPQGEARGGERHKYAFTTTSWSAVMAASQADTSKSMEALAQLCQSYWPPLYAYVRRMGHNDNDAKDLTQEFFYVLISKNYLGAADRQKGKFRSFLLTAFKHFLANEWDKSRAAKRGGGQTLLSLDQPAEEDGWIPEPVAADVSPGKMYERRWAQTLFRQAEARLREEYAAAGKEALFAQLRPFLDETTGAGEYGPAAQAMGMSQGAMRMAVHRARHRFGEVLRGEVGRTLVNPTAQEIDEELHHLFEAFSGGG